MIIDTHKLLGSLFYQATSKEQLITIVEALVESEVLSQECLLALRSADEDALAAEFSRLFEGVGDMPAPPWGSVYLDKDRVVFGASTVEYRQFLSGRQRHSAYCSGARPPPRSIKEATGSTSTATSCALLLVTITASI